MLLGIVCVCESKIRFEIDNSRSCVSVRRWKVWWRGLDKPPHNSRKLNVVRHS
jgi:hypothetical protein